MSERPSTVNSRMVKDEVQERWHKRFPQTNVGDATVSAIVRETLQVLAEWELIEMFDLPADGARRDGT